MGTLATDDSSSSVLSICNTCLTVSDSVYEDFWSACLGEVNTTTPDEGKSLFSFFF